MRLPVLVAALALVLFLISAFFHGGCDGEE